MPGKDPNPNPGTKVPQVVTTSHTCPHCGKVNTVTLSQATKGYTCPGCGKNTGSLFDGAESIQAAGAVKCPRCRSESVEIRDGGKKLPLLKLQGGMVRDKTLIRL